MLSKRFFKLFLKNKFPSQLSRAQSGDSKGQLFFEPKIQEILQKLATPELEKCFPAQKLGQKLKPPEYKFMTDKELEQSIAEARQRATKWMQMPPVLDASSDTVDIIEEDPALDGFDEDNARWVFTDITFGLKEKDRLIAVREPDGTLRYANKEERHRMLQTYFPRPGRELVTPPMFEGEYLESLLERKEYKFILDRACAQFEPDNVEYIRVTTTTYERVAEQMDFDLLFGTRHFGSMIFHLVFNRNVDKLLLHTLKDDRLDDAISLVHLYHMIHPDASSASSPAEGTELLRAFIDQDVVRKSVLELALQACLERLREKKAHLETVEKAHGLQS